MPTESETLSTSHKSINFQNCKCNVCHMVMVNSSITIVDYWKEQNTIDVTKDRWYGITFHIF